MEHFYIADFLHTFACPDLCSCLLALYTFWITATLKKCIQYNNDRFLTHKRQNYSSCCIYKSKANRKREIHIIRLEFERGQSEATTEFCHGR